jgi:hypothetical protein
MKAVRLVLIAGGLLIALVLVAGLIAPKDVTIERSTLIKAPSTAIFPHIKYIDKMAAWHPWLKKDGNLLTSVEGQDGTLDAIRKWDSKNPDVGTGQERIVALVENEMIETDVHVLTPKESHAKSKFVLTDVQGQTQVIWQFKYEVPYPFNAFMMFSDPTSELEKGFSNGLAGLKKILERMERSAVNYMATEYQWRGGLYIIRREKIARTEQLPFAQNALKELMDIRNNAGLKRAGYPIGLIYEEDNETGQIDYAFGIPVYTADDLEDVETVEIQSGAQSFALFVNDLYGDGKKAHSFLTNHINDLGKKELHPNIEEYLKGPLSEEMSGSASVRVIHRYE